ncbi:MAG: hypothetical protein ACRCZH_01055 [Cetobacterium sp.]
MEKLKNLGNEQYVCMGYPYSLMINTAEFELVSDTRLNHVIRATKKGKYIIASTMRSSSTAGEDCSIGISKNNDHYSVAFTLMAGTDPSVFEMTSSITRVVSLNPGDIIDILRTKAEPSKPQRVISILKI